MIYITTTAHNKLFLILSTVKLSNFNDLNDSLITTITLFAYLLRKSILLVNIIYFIAFLIIKW